MPQIQTFELGNSRGKLADALGLSLGQGIGNGLNTYFANRSLDSVLQDKRLEGAPQSKKLEAIRSALSPYGEKGQEIFKQRMEIEAEDKKEKELQKEEVTRNNLAKALGYIQKNQDVPDKILQSLPQDVQLKVGDFSKSNRVANNLYETMVKAGVPEEIAQNQAELVRSSEKGTGQTYALQGANDLINRFRNIPESEPFNQNVGSGKFSKINPEYEFPLPEKTQGLTLKERATKKHEYEQQNLKDYNENRTRKRNLEEDKFSFKKLEELNPYISTGAAKWNIDPKSGDIIFPALATPEERQFAKIIVRQLRNAKDTFGARVSNFDAATYLEGFPSLADSPEAREALLKDLQVVNQLNLLHSNAMEEVYRTYKPGEISPQQAEQIADDIAMKKAEELWGQFTQVPNRNEGAGKKPPLEKATTLDEIF